jgi:putative ABC transport system substrate-binding protein
LRGKYLDVLKQAVPAATRMGVLWNPANPVHVDSQKALKTAAQELKVELHLAGVQYPKDFETAFSTLTQAKVEALAMLPDGMFLSQRDAIIRLAAVSRLPVLYGVIEFAEAGGLMAYGANLADLFRKGAIFVDRILKGAKPADLPIEQPTNFQLVINSKTAKALGLTIPQSILIQADRVIE